jgi:formate dehydrogenase major subunit
MTNHWVDLRNADVVLVMGANPASNHPISWRWVAKAQEKGGTVITVDPRFTQSASKSDIYAPLRSGTDIAFLGGMLKYILDNNLIFADYVKLYTNATHLVNPAFKGPGELDGLFSGYDAATRKYDKATWSFQVDEKGVVKKDPSMKDPNCVYQLLKKHYSRYTLDKVSEITGCPKDKLVEVYKAYASTNTPDRTGTSMYAMGWTQHTVGVQNIRAMSIIQSLLGNMGVPGGGINALRGESNVQGSTDFGLLFHILPGYLRTSTAADTTYKAYSESLVPKTAEPQSLNWMKNYPKYTASLLRAFYGLSAGGDLEKQFHWLPKTDVGQNCSWLTIFDQMYKGNIKGFFAWGQNPAASGSNSNKVRNALKKLEWMVTVNLFDNETASFWRGPGMNPSEIKTEVFFLPCVFIFEKSGSLNNSGRLQQWRYKAAQAPGTAKPDADIMNDLYWKVRKLYATKGGAFPAPILNLTWNYGEVKDGRIHEIDPELVAYEINGYWMVDKTIDDATTKQPRPFRKGDLVPAFTYLQDDGSTCSGSWIMCGSAALPVPAVPAGKDDKGNPTPAVPAKPRSLKSKGRKKDDPTGMGLFPGWAWSWPVNRRIIYNRAAVNGFGKPWSPKKNILEWNPAAEVKPLPNLPPAKTPPPLGGWKGDVVDGGGAPPFNADGTSNEKGVLPFIMKGAGVASLFGGATMAEGPFPEHYEPLECPVERNLLNGQRISPTVKIFKDAPEDVFATCDDRFPLVGTTYRQSEHWQTGVITRWLPTQAELAPGNFVEMSVELARERGIANGEKVIVESARGQIEAVAIVTPRFKPFKVGNNPVHQVGVPWHYGWATTAAMDVRANGRPYSNPTHGDSANLLCPTVGDSNTMIPETKAFMVNVRKIGAGGKGRG